MTKIGSLAMCAMMAFSFAACGDKGGTVNRDKTTVIEVAVHQGGVGYVWLQEAAKRFETANAEKSYAEGKTGVKIEITPGGTALASQSMGSDSYNIYLVERTDTYPFIANGLFLDISEVMEMEDSNGRTLEERINPSIVPTLKGNDGKTYVLPGWEFYSGVSYDKETFDEKYAYIADSSAEDALEYESDYGTLNMIGTLTTKRSCGPDGEYGTDDDGLPSSLEELLILCSYLKKEGVEPFTLPGSWPGYCKYLLAGLWTSLAGYDSMKAVYNFGGETVEIIKSDENGNLMFTDENLFTGIDYLKKPVTETVQITTENGYLTNDMTAKYYAAAFLQILETEGFLSADASNAVGHTDAQMNFLTGGTETKRKGMIMEGSYWWGESEMAGNFEDYNILTEKDAKDRDIRWMPLPTSLDTPTTEGNGEKNTLIDTCFSSCYINNNIKNNEELKTASIDFVKFLYSEEELVNFTKDTGSFRPIDYEVASSEFDSIFYRELVELRNNSNVVQFAAENNNDIFRYHRGALKIELGGSVFTANYNSKPYDSYLLAYRAGATAVDAINSTRFSQDEWSTFL